MITYVLGTRISLTPEIVGEILHIPQIGSSLNDPEDEAWDDYKKKDFYYNIDRLNEAEFRAKRIRGLGGVIPSRDSWSAGNFFIDDRLFHYFIVYIMFLRAGNH